MPVISTPGQLLDGEIRRQMSNRLGHDFSRVRVHRGPVASVSSRTLGTRAYAVGNHLVIDQDAVGTSAHSAAGRDLLAHELTHVVQQGAHAVDAKGAAGFAGLAIGGAAEQQARHIQAGGLASPTQQLNGPVVQREDPDDRKKQEPVQNEIPSPDAQPQTGLEWPGPAAPSLVDGGLQMDPMLMWRVQQLLARERIQAGLYDLDLSTLDRLYPSPALDIPQAPKEEKKPAVPPGKGPDKPREGKPGDLLKAVTKVPAVDAALTGLKDQALSRVKRDWRKRSTGGKAVLVSSLVLVGGGAVGSLMAHDPSRTAVLGFIKGKDLPVPGVPGLSMQLNLVGPDLGVRFGLNVGSLLPKSWGFK